MNKEEENLLHLLDLNRELYLELRKARARSAQLSARLQVIREGFRETDWLLFCNENPEVATWFDTDGVPR